MKNVKIIYITPKMRLNESEEEFNVVKRRITGLPTVSNIEKNNTTNYDVDVDSMIKNADYDEIEKNLIFKKGHSNETKGIYAFAESILNKVLQGIKFNLIYKLVEGEEDTYGKVDPMNVYDIQILEVSPDAAYIIHDPEKEINGDKIQLNRVLRTDLFKIIIESPAYQQTFPNCNFIKGIREI